MLSMEADFLVLLFFFNKDSFFFFTSETVFKSF